MNRKREGRWFPLLSFFAKQKPDTFLDSSSYSSSSSSSSFSSSGPLFLPPPPPPLSIRVRPVIQRAPTRTVVKFCPRADARRGAGGKKKEDRSYPVNFCTDLLHTEVHKRVRKVYATTATAATPPFLAAGKAAPPPFASYRACIEEIWRHAAKSPPVKISPPQTCFSEPKLGFRKMAFLKKTAPHLSPLCLRLSLVSLSTTVTL